MALGLLSLISTRAPALDAAAGASSIGEWEAAWTKVLTRHVDDSGRIDFDSLRRNHADLDLVVAFVAAGRSHHAATTIPGPRIFSHAPRV